MKKINKDLENELQIKLVLHDERMLGKAEGVQEMRDKIFYFLQSKVVTLEGNIPVIHVEYLKQIHEIL